jgi:formylmethanofuran dehydrogenase subunit A
MDNDPELIRMFEQYYSIQKENYPVDEEYYLPNSVKIETEVKL